MPRCDAATTFPTCYIVLSRLLSSHPEYSLLFNLYKAVPTSLMPHVTCIGCNRQFSPSGYTRHLSMTKREHCRSLRGPQRNSRTTRATPSASATLRLGNGDTMRAALSCGTNQGLGHGNTSGVALGASAGLNLGDNTTDAALTTSASGMTRPV
jgi:hypothetical protein